MNRTNKSAFTFWWATTKVKILFKFFLFNEAYMFDIVRLLGSKNGVDLIQISNFFSVLLLAVFI